MIGPWSARWAVDSQGQVTERSYYDRALATGATPDVIAGVDLLEDDGMSTEKAVEMMAAAHRSGRDAEAFARHLIKLRKAWRDP